MQYVGDLGALSVVPGDASAEFVRFGLGQPHILAASAWRYASGRGDGAWGLSVWWWPALTAEEIVRAAFGVRMAETGKNPFVQGVYRTLSRRALHDFDFTIAVRKTYGPGHYTIELPSFLLEQHFEPAYHDRTTFPAYEHNADYFDQLAALLGSPVPNPVRTL